MLDEDLREAFATDVVLLKYVGLNPVIVHGGGPEITRYMERLGLEVKLPRGPAGLRRGDRRGGEDGPGRQAQLRNRPAAQPPRPARGRPRRRGRHPVRGRAGRQRRPGRLRRLDRAGRRRRPQPHRRRLHPGDRLLGLRPRRPVLQRQRRRGRRQGRRRARRPQGDLPHRRRGLAGRRRRRGLADLAAPRWARSSGQLEGVDGRDAAEAAGLRRRDQRRRPVGPHHRRPRRPTASCWSCSPTPASAPWSRREPGRGPGARGALPDADLQTGAGRLRPRRGSRCSGTPTARSTSTSSPGSRSARSATATPPWSRRSASRRGS